MIKRLTLFLLLLMFMLMLMHMYMPLKNKCSHVQITHCTRLLSILARSSFGKDFNSFGPWVTWWAKYLTNTYTTAWWKLSSIALESGNQVPKTLDPLVS